MGPPGGLKLSGLTGAPKNEGSKFGDFGQIMWVSSRPVKVNRNRC
jgi:hypothetical protein